MKKILFGGVAAIFTSLGLSSFKQSKSQANRYYFYVTTNVPVGATLFPSEVSYLGTIDPGGDMCPGVISTAYICVIGVSVGNVTHVNFTHLNGPKGGATIYTRGNGY